MNHVSRIIEHHGTADVLKSCYCGTGSSFEVPTPHLLSVRSGNESGRRWDAGFMPAFIRVHA